MMRKYAYARKRQALDNDTLSLEETLFHSANGYFGVRGAFEEGYPEDYVTVRGAYINGVYDIVPMPQAELLPGLATEKQTLVNVSDVQDIKLYVDDELCTPFTGGLAESERMLDMARGVVTRRFVWKSPAGKTLRLNIVRMASFVRPSLFLLLYTVAADEPCELQLVAAHHADVRNFSDPNDPRVAAESLKHIIVDRVRTRKSKEGCYSTIATHTAKSGISVVTNLLDTIDAPTADVATAVFPKCVVHRFSVKAETEVPVTFTRYAVFTDGRRYSSPESDGAKLLASAVTAGSARLLEEQAAYLTSFWNDFDFDIDGDDVLSEALTFNVFQLLQSVGKDGYSHLAAKGLSGEGYEGHYFWDTEMYVQPLFTLMRPEISRQLLTYRYSSLPLARENARTLGHRRGALYPWRTISGKECSGFFPAGTAQYHIDGAIAYAVVMYYLVTGDDDFMESMGLELLLEIARLWYDLGTYHEGRFQLHCVTGPDEYTCVVNNNYYTNVSAKYDLRRAVELYRDFDRRGLADRAKRATGITDAELCAFTEAAEAMYLPYDAKLDITPQDDSFLSKKVWDVAATPPEDFPLLMHYHPLTLYRHQVCKQADAVLAHFLYEDEVDFSTMMNSFRYYEKLTTHDSSLSTCVFSIMASRLGLADEAYAYFGDSVEIDIRNTHGNTKDGIHTANMGGSYLAILFGFAGLRIKESGFYLAPAVPRTWRGYHFSLKLRGRVLKVHVDHTDVSLQFKSPVVRDGGQTLRVFLYGEPVAITAAIQTYPLRTPAQ